MTKIEWTDRTWNPVTGCTKISTGCKNCYAEKMANRLKAMGLSKYANGFEVTTHPEYLTEPYHWKKPAMVFVCSMGDLFHESVPFDFIDKVYEVIYNNPQHTFQVLTKRPERVIEWQEHYYDTYCTELWVKNLWLGVTAENQEQADDRILWLSTIPAYVTFVSCEPLLSNIDLPMLNFEGDKVILVDWVIAGPETGINARQMQKEWIENLYNKCKENDIPFFDKKNILGLNLKQYPI